MYILLENNIVKEHIPDINPELPGIPIEERYSPSFLEDTIYVDDSSEIPEGYVYDPETGEFSEPDPVPEPEPVDPEPTLDERVTALEESNAEMTEALDMILSGVTE